MWGEQEGCSCAGDRGTQRSREPASARESRPGAGVWGGLEWSGLLGARALRCLVSAEGGAGAKAGWGSAGGAELVTVSLATNTQTGCSHSRRPPCMVLEGCRMRALWRCSGAASREHPNGTGRPLAPPPAAHPQGHSSCAPGDVLPLPCPALPCHPACPRHKPHISGAGTAAC